MSLLEGKKEAGLGRERRDAPRTLQKQAGLAQTHLSSSYIHPWTGKTNKSLGLS